MEAFGLQSSLWVVGLHVLLMFLAFGLFTPLSVFIARHGRGWLYKRNRNWYDWHLKVQLVSHICSGIGVIVPFLFLADQETFFHVRHLHGVLGVVVAFCTLFMQPILGTIDDRYPERDERGKLYRHSLLGRVLFVAAFFVMYLGLLLLKPPNSLFFNTQHDWWYYWIEKLMISWFLLLIAIFNILELRKRYHKRR